MGYVVTDTVGLIIAALNVATFILLIYIFLGLVAGEQSKLFCFLDRIFRIPLSPLRDVLPQWKFDIAPVILVILLQVIALLIRL